MKNATIEIIEDKKSKKVEVIVKGDLTLTNTLEIKGGITEELQKHKSLQLKFTEIKILDLAGIQLLYSVKKQNENSKRVSVIFDLSEENKRVLSQSGFKDIN